MADAVMDAPVDSSTPDMLDAPKPVDASIVEKLFLGRIDSSKRHKRQFMPEWKRNVELRLGRPLTVFTGSYLPDTGELRTEINPDWSLTKTKTANLYSQVPQVQITHENKQYAAAIPPFAKSLNYELGDKRANIGVAMREVMNDVVNAAGVGAIVVSYVARFETVMVPQQDPLAQSGPIDKIKQMLGFPAPQPQMVPVQRVVSDKFCASRISPSDLLWPSEFTGSCFDDADWIGHTVRTNWADAKNEFKLTDAQKDSVVKGAEARTEYDLRSEPDKPGLGDLEVVTYDSLYYWRSRVDPEEKSFKAIWRFVRIHGLEEGSITKAQKQVLHGPWKGQQYDEQSRKYVGACKFPVQVLTLTYITDNPVPPSDSSAGRPQVNDLRRSRSQMFANRDRSRPVRGFDVNRVDPLIQAQLMAGTWQDMIPFNGDGSRALFEVARASYPAEDLSFDRTTMADLMQTWQVGPNQIGTQSTGEKTAAESKITQANFSTRIGEERTMTASFFLNVCEVMAGLMALYSDFPILTDAERQAMTQAWDRRHILHDLVLKIRPDSTIMLDSQARIERLMSTLNMLVKSGFINPLPIITEIIELSGLDPSEIVKPPTPPPPDLPKVSYSFSGKDDLVNPLVVATMIHSKVAPSMQDIQQAQQLLLAAQQPEAVPQPVQPGAPMGGPPVGPPGAAPAGPSPTAPVPVEAHPDWQLSSKIAQRSRDIRG